MEEEKKERQPIDLIHIGRLLWSERKFIAKVSFAFLVVTAILVYSLPRSYSSTVMLAPEMSNTSGISGSLSSLASMAGVSLGNESEDAIYPMIYPDVVSSNQFLVDLFDIRVRTVDKKIDTTLMTYMLKHQKSPWWSSAIKPLKKWLKSLKKKTEGPAADVINPFWLSKENDELCRGLQGCINCSVDKKTDVITLSFTAQDPLVAATVTDSIREHLQHYITDYRTAKARNDLEYAQKLLSEAKVKYKETQRAYASYCDSHQNTILQSYITQQESLENAMQLAFNEYTQLTQQVQAAKAKVQERTPAFAIVQCASVPQKPSAPKRLLSMLASIIFGFLTASAYVYLRKEILA